MMLENILRKRYRVFLLLEVYAIIQTIIHCCQEHQTMYARNHESGHLELGQNSLFPISCLGQ